MFSIDELVTVLREENGRDICTIHVPKRRNYVDYLVLVSGRSKRHLVAMAEYVKWLVSVTTVLDVFSTFHCLWRVPFGY